jgi:hypothetical protein
MAAPDAAPTIRRAIGDPGAEEARRDAAGDVRRPGRVDVRRPSERGRLITFAGVMVVMSAILNIIDGIAATRPLRAGGPRRASDVQLRGVR